MPPESTRFQDAHLRIDGPIAEFSHQRPQARNALSMALRDDYARLLERLHGDPTIRVLIITGSNGSFCAGGDVKTMSERLADADPARNSPDATRRRLEDAHRWLTPLHELSIPVVAAVDGAAYGAGFALALQADFVLASERAAFAMSFARVGAVPDFGALYLLPRIIGLAAAKDVMITGRRIGAEEARSMGMVHAVHPTDQLLPAAHAFARKLAAGPREATAMTKNLLNKSFETDYATMCSLEAYAQGIAMHTPYHARSVARFATGEPSAYDWDRI